MVLHGDGRDIFPSVAWVADVLAGGAGLREGLGGFQMDRSL